MLIQAKEMLQVVGRLMKSSSWLIKGLCFDAHSTHRYMREALFGSFETLDQKALKDFEFWQDCEYENVPQHALPRLPLRICKVEGESVWALPGPCNLEVERKFFWGLHGTVEYFCVILIDLN